jgi:diaminohydroxyphosphoribosylaminopyrimidine deaminase/5-amino-6-(5-phosphoribosylamino)uracil reductase
MSLDGRIATAGGQSQWISSPEGRRWGLALREEHDAILAGSGTVLADDPRLDRRLGLAYGPNLRVILDRRLRVPPEARLFTVPGPVLIYAEAADGINGIDGIDPVERRSALEARGAEVALLPSVEPAAVLADLYGRGIRSVLVEGGGEVHGSFAGSGCFDCVAVDCAPLLIGGRTAPGPLGGAGFQLLEDAARLDRLEARARGGDLVLTGYRKGCLPDLFKSVGA